VEQHQQGVAADALTALVALGDEIAVEQHSQ
jgi:hypothetical protein